MRRTRIGVHFWQTYYAPVTPVLSQLVQGQSSDICYTCSPLASYQKCRGYWVGKLHRKKGEMLSFLLGTLLHGNSHVRRQPRWGDTLTTTAGIPSVLWACISKWVSFTNCNIIVWCHPYQAPVYDLPLPPHYTGRGYLYTYLALLSVPVIQWRVHTTLGTCAQTQRKRAVIEWVVRFMAISILSSCGEGYLPSEAELTEPQVGRSRSQLMIASFKCFSFLSASASRRSAWCSSSCNRRISDAPPPGSARGKTEVDSLAEILLCTSRE